MSSGLSESSAFSHLTASVSEEAQSPKRVEGIPHRTHTALRAYVRALAWCASAARLFRFLMCASALRRWHIALRAYKSHFSRCEGRRALSTSHGVAYLHKTWHQTTSDESSDEVSYENGAVTFKISLFLISNIQEHLLLYLVTGTVQ